MTRKFSDGSLSWDACVCIQMMVYMHDPFVDAVVVARDGRVVDCPGTDIDTWYASVTGKDGGAGWKHSVEDRKRRDSGLKDYLNHVLDYVPPELSFSVASEMGGGEVRVGARYYDVGVYYCILAYPYKTHEFYLIYADAPPKAAP